MKNIIQLRNGEIASGRVFEVISIPTLDTVQESFRLEDDIEDKYRKSFISLLTEIHQSYKIYLKENIKTELSIESLWITEKVDNQPFKARIRFFCSAFNFEK